MSIIHIVPRPCKWGFKTFSLALCYIVPNVLKSWQQVAWIHGESTTRELKGRWRHFFTQIEPYWPLPYSAMPVPLLAVGGCQAGGLGHLLQYMRKYNAQSPKQGRKRFNSIVKTINISYFPIIYQCMDQWQGSLRIFAATVLYFFNWLSPQELTLSREKNPRSYAHLPTVQKKAEEKISIFLE